MHALLILQIIDVSGQYSQRTYVDGDAGNAQKRELQSIPACRMSGNLTSIQHNNYQTQTTAVSSQLCCMAQSVGECVLHLSKYHASF